MYIVSVRQCIGFFRQDRDFVELFSGAGQASASLKQADSYSHAVFSCFMF